MFPTSRNLPAPDEAALAISRELTELVESRIREAGGWLPFDEYMRQVLYMPGFGYYSAGSAKIGVRGDFVTAPELGPFLARAIAAFARPMLETLDAPQILEIGAGTGRLAVQLIDELEKRGPVGIDYRILETSADLRARQTEALSGHGERVAWLDRLPENGFEGLILANEVVDALPVKRFLKRNGKVLPLGVAIGESGLESMTGPEDPTLAAAVLQLEAALGSALSEPYESEICAVLPGWLRALAQSIERGAILLIDYGLVRREYYHPDRTTGTLVCHYRHRVHDDPFLYPGLSDLTAWVDFSACATAALAAGLAVGGFTTQANFVLAALDSATGGDLDDSSPQALSALKTLVLPGEMGERFKVMLLSQNIPGLSLPGRDLRNWL